MLLWIPAGMAIFLFVGLFITMAYLVWKGGREEQRRLFAHSCKFCGYDLSQTSLWPRLQKGSTQGVSPEPPKCPECGRLVTGIAGVDLPDSLPTLARPERPSTP